MKVGGKLIENKSQTFQDLRLVLFFYYKYLCKDRFTRGYTMWLLVAYARIRLLIKAVSYYWVYFYKHLIPIMYSSLWFRVHYACSLLSLHYGLEITLLIFESLSWQAILAACIYLLTSFI